MKFGIGAKIVLLLIAVVTLTAAVPGVYLFWTSRAIVLDHELVDLSDETSLRAYDLMSYLYRIRRGFRSFKDHEDALNDFVSSGETTDLEPLTTIYCSCFDEPPKNHLRFEFWLADGPRLEQLHVLGEDSQRAQLVEPDREQPRDSTIADFRNVLQQVKEPRLFDVFLSDIGVVNLVEADHTRSVNAVWCGCRIAVSDTGRELYAAALVDLDAPVSADEESPLAPVRDSERHLGVLANFSAMAGAGPVDAEQADSDGLGLLFLSGTEKYYQDTEPLRQSFAVLYKKRPSLKDAELAQSLVVADDEDAIEGAKIELARPLWYWQTDSIGHPELRTKFTKEIEKPQRDETDPLYGKRVGVGGADEYFVRLLADSKESGQEAIAAINRVAAGIADDIRIHWRDPVRCTNCEFCYVLFRVSSAGVPGNVRYYGLARGAFREEMQADVDNELMNALYAALAIAGIVTLAGFAVSLFITRPLKRITHAAEAVGQTHVDSANNLWQQEIDSIGRMLPVHRGDEIGVLARALRQMIGDLLTGQVRLQHLNADLDRRVTERTEELQRANVELKAARDEADELSRAKDAFLASVSHELRNPLNQVSGFCQLLELTELDEDQRADLKKIKQAGSQLLALINDILDYQKIVMGGITLEPEQLDVAELLGEIRDAITFPAAEKGIELRVDWSDDVGTIHVDKQRLRQVLLNLAGNACKFTQQGGVHIHAERIPRKEGVDAIAFTVADTGRGMTPDEQTKLFMPFTKLAANQGNQAGTGLGLVISKGFSESMGGSIGVSSEYGKGSTFTVQIPEKSPKLSSSSSSSDVIAALTGSSRVGRSAAGSDRVSPDDSTWRTADRIRLSAALRAGHTVLVVDDDVDVREMMKRFLGAQGFDVRTAANGMEGLELARQLRPAAITLDAIMPGLDGWAVLAALKADRETADIPVIMVTMVDNRQRGQIMGADEYIVKPIDWQRLSRVLDRFVTTDGKQSLLVVEDDQATRELLRRNLEHDGWSVLEAEHGAEALEVLAVKTPAAILLDLMMPVMDGFEFLNRQSADARAIPIIVITAKDPTPEEFERLNGRAARVLLKGQYTQDQLLHEIHRWLDGQLQSSTVTRGDKQNA